MRRFASFLVVFLVLAGCSEAASQAAARQMSSVVALSHVGTPERPGQTFCSGVAITPTHVLTAAHCVMPQWEMLVNHENGVKKRAKPSWVNHTTDLAILTVEEGGLVPAPVGNSDETQRGDWVSIAGMPYGIMEFSYAVGYVGYVNRIFPAPSSPEEEFVTGRFFQVYIESRGGNSGGPMFNAQGEVVGIVSRSDRTGITFVVPVNDRDDYIYESQEDPYKGMY